MSISTKDNKILWAKAAGRCSMKDCRKEVIVASEDLTSEKKTLIGENCHIVGEKNTKESPRGLSSLSEKERNSYTNLILLCRNHHRIIDQDEEIWTIERLHQIKDEHELWVETSLSVAENKDDIWYVDLINLITEELHLEKWDPICDHALRHIVYEKFICGINHISHYIFRAVFPKKRLLLEEKIKNLDNHASKFSKHFMSNAEPAEDEWFRAKTFYKDIYPNPNYHRDLDKYNQWQKISLDLLFNFVVALNEFSNQVREEINPDYLKYQGKFVVIDSMGIIGGTLAYTSYMPDEFISIDEDFKL